MDDFLTLHPRTKWATGQPKLDLPVLKDYIVKYQDPRQADSIMKIQQELDETKIVLHKTIESVLERGEKIDNLVQRSENLSSQSKLFYTQVSHNFYPWRRGLIDRALMIVMYWGYRRRSKTHVALYHKVVLSFLLFNGCG